MFRIFKTEDFFELMSRKYDMFDTGAIETKRNILKNKQIKTNALQTTINIRTYH
jgi:hypothetical protein